MRRVEEYIEINAERLARLSAPYNPYSGEGCDACRRVAVDVSDGRYPTLWLPERMTGEPLVRLLSETGSFKDTARVLSGEGGAEFSPYDIMLSFIKLRIRYDFEFWAASYVRIKTKGRDEREAESVIPFVLNRGQRKYLRTLYGMWEEGRPIRVILLKARQWGGSTLTQIFMMWIQLVHRKWWHSAICTQVENTANTVRGMFDTALRYYPYVLDDEAAGPMELRPYQGSVKTRIVSPRECCISVGSAEKPESLRGLDFSMAHFSEVALFAATDGKKPEDLIQSIVSGIPSVRDSLIVYESTAKGVGNFFHREWLRAKRHDSAFTPVFVAWFEIEMYSSPIDDYAEFIAGLTEYELRLFEWGATLEAINWYKNVKCKEIPAFWRRASEFPSNDIEAFQSTGRRFYNIDDVDRLRRGCIPPAMTAEVIADGIHGSEALSGITIKADPKGRLKVWELPDSIRMANNRYVVVVDVNRGTSEKADNGIICVLDRYWMKEPGGKPEVVAEWAGHLIMRHFVWVAVQIAKLYHDAFLVIESNTPESSGQSGFEMESVFDEIAEYYDNMYCRTPADQIVAGVPRRWGFHTNRSSKYMVCTHQQKVLAEDMYIERSIDAVDEHDTFEVKENGSLGAVEGCRDDRHITRAIGVWICYNELKPPVEIPDGQPRYSTARNIANESTL